MSPDRLSNLESIKSSAKRMNAWQAMVNALKNEGIEYVFGLPGSDLFYDALYDVPEIKPVRPAGQPSP